MPAPSDDPICVKALCPQSGPQTMASRDLVDDTKSDAPTTCGPPPLEQSHLPPAACSVDQFQPA